MVRIMTPYRHTTYNIRKRPELKISSLRSSNFPLCNKIESLSFSEVGKVKKKRKTIGGEKTSHQSFLVNFSSEFFHVETSQLFFLFLPLLILPHYLPISFSLSRVGTSPKCVCSSLSIFLNFQNYLK